MSQPLETHYVCSGCGTVVPDREARPFVCAHRGDGGDHVLVRRFVSASRHRELLTDAIAGDERQPFVRFRRLFHSWHVARAEGMRDDDYVQLVRSLDARVADADGRGFLQIPLAHSDTLALELGRASGTLVVKNETLNVSGSHKARHLMQVAIWLETTAALGWTASTDPPPLAIASCGNAALAAAVVARAMRRRLLVFVPTDAEAGVIERIQELEAEIQICPRQENQSGDPCLHAFQAAVRDGALPFGCQGSENGITVEGGLTLGYEILGQLRERRLRLDDVVVQVGGGALASGVFQALLEAHRLGVLEADLPRLHTVQTQGASPLHRAYEKILQRSADSGSDVESALAHAARHRDEYMWPWETTPVSYATGILDDETYDWLALVEGMLRSRGEAVIADEDTLREAHALARIATGIDVCATGSSGLAGLMTLQREGRADPGANALVIFTGAQR